MTIPAPYPTDTRAKGWRFELDMERARQSDTWAIASPEARPWLLMLWATAWEQTPCGSLPNDDELIAARIGMPAKLFAKHRAILLRKWWLADDGRLYHGVLVQRVTEMMKTRRSEADRKAAARARDAARMADGVAPDSGGVPVLSHGTDAGLPPESGTGTGTGTGSKQGFEASEERGARASHDPEQTTPTAAGLVCRAMKAAGLQSVNPGDPRLSAMLAQGVTEAEFVGVAIEAVAGGKGWAWVLHVVAARRAEAAAIAIAPGGPPPQRGPAAPNTTVSSAAAERTQALLREQRQRAPDRPTPAVMARLAAIKRVPA